MSASAYGAVVTLRKAKVEAVSQARSGDSKPQTNPQIICGIDRKVQNVYLGKDGRRRVRIWGDVCEDFGGAVREPLFGKADHRRRAARRVCLEEQMLSKELRFGVSQCKCPLSFLTA